MNGTTTCDINYDFAIDQLDALASEQTLITVRELDDSVVASVFRVIDKAVRSVLTQDEVQKVILVLLQLDKVYKLGRVSHKVSMETW